MILLLTLLLWLLPCHALADEGAKWMVRAYLEPAGEVVVGQPVKLVVDVLVTTWFAGAPQFPAFDVQGALVTLSDEQPAHLTEDINGEKWFGISRIYRITPMEPREYTIPRVQVLVHPGLVEKPVRLWTPLRKLHARVPPGAKGMAQFFAATQLDMAQTFDRPLQKLRAGDAFTRTVTLTAKGTQGMFLPPLSFEGVDGLTIYLKAPVVENLSQDRQGFVAGRRTESVTYMIQRAGQYRLPGMTVQWWDSVGKKIREGIVPPVTFDVAATPGYRPEIAIPVDNASGESFPAEEALRPSRVWLIGLAGLLAILGWLWPRVRKYATRLTLRLAERRRRYDASEAAAFARLCRVAAGDDDEGTVRSLYRWLDRCESVGKPGLAERATVLAQDDQYRQATETLFNRRFGSSQPSSDHSNRELERALRRVRARLSEDNGSSGPKDEKSLPPLNPSFISRARTVRK
jgi:hypothetical protein